MKRIALLSLLVPSFLLAQTTTNYVYDTTTNSTASNTNVSTSTNTNNNVSTSTATNTNYNVQSGTMTNINQNTSASTATNTNYNVQSGTMTNINQNTSTATNTNYNYGDVTNRNITTATNVNTDNSTVNQTINSTTNSTNSSTTVSTATNTNVNDSKSTSYSDSTQSVSQKIVSPPPSAIAPTMMSYSQDLCTTGMSGAVQTQILGISAGKTIRDKNCEALKLSKTLYDMGMRVAAVSLLCQDDRVFNAMRMAGTPCPFEGKIGKEATAAWEAKAQSSSRR